MREMIYSMQNEHFFNFVAKINNYFVDRAIKRKYTMQGAFIEETRFD